MRDCILKTANGFDRDDGIARYRYDRRGNYLGQYQPDMLSEDPDAGDIWLATYPGDKCFHQLTDDQMAAAERA